MTDKKWQLQPNGLVVRAGSYAIRITSGPMGQSHTAQIADLKRRKEIARLISAAPEMLEALEDILGGWRYIRQDPHHKAIYGVGWDRAQEKAEAAIRKAKGGDA
jgi:hypothetical protein